jgi:hypothetical protein
MVSYLMTLAYRHYRNVNCLPFIGIIDALQGDVFLVLKKAIKFGPEAMKPKLCQQKLHICADKGAIPYANDLWLTNQLGEDKYLCHPRDQQFVSTFQANLFDFVPL